MGLLRRIVRRNIGMLAKRIPEARFDQVVDPRDARGKRWSLAALLGTVVFGMMSGCRSLREVEVLTDVLTPSVRAWLGIPRRVPDTTLRDALCSLQPGELRQSLHAAVRAARRRHALEPDLLPFGVVSLDGKDTAVPSCDDFFAQRQTQQDGAFVGNVRTITATLTSSSARPVIDVLSVPASTNEMGVFRSVLRKLWDTYRTSDLFRLVTYDAGACCKDNADAVRELGLHYLFGLKSNQPTLYQEAERWLGSRGTEHADATSSDHERGGTVVRRIYLGQTPFAPEGWAHLATLVRVESETLDAHGERVAYQNRYFVSSLPRSRLKDELWLLLIRRHWGVETSHQMLDTAFAEDDHPFIEQNPRATVVLMVLRRIAYTLTALWRGVTLRSDASRLRPWRELMHELYLCAVTATAAQLAGLRRHRLARAAAPAPAPA